MLLLSYKKLRVLQLYSKSCFLQFLKKQNETWVDVFFFFQKMLISSLIEIEIAPVGMDNGRVIFVSRRHLRSAFFISMAWLLNS